MNWKLRRAIYTVTTLVEAVCVTGANRLRRVLGFEVPRHPTHEFLRIYLHHALGRPQTLRVTCADRSDGAGAQAHTMVAAMAYAHACGHQYVHTPFAEIAHAERPMEDWVTAWESLLNLGSAGADDAAGRPRALNYSTFHPRLYHALLSGTAGLVERAAATINRRSYEPGHFHPFFHYVDAHPEAYRDMVPVIRNGYYRDTKPIANPIVTVGVHVRRGDINSVHRRRFTPMRKVAATCEQIAATLDQAKRPFRMVVHSVGSEHEFDELRRSGVELNLNGDAIATFRLLVEADILVMSKSSYSFMAALLSDGVVLYEPFWHSPLNDWIQLNRRGRFKAAELRGRLESVHVPYP